MQLAIILAIVIAVAGVAFAVQNSVPATVIFLLWRFDSSLGVILLLTLAVGGLIVALASTPSTLRAGWVNKRQRKEIETLKSTNAELRARLAALERRSPAPQAPAAEP
jgi:uncharacterized integral membrane protein